MTCGIKGFKLAIYSLYFAGLMRYQGKQTFTTKVITLQQFSL
jgi:hypothetical protein